LQGGEWLIVNWAFGQYKLKEISGVDMTDGANDGNGELRRCARTRRPVFKDFTNLISSESTAEQTGATAEVLFGMLELVLAYLC
jgi:hypothetical protein